jgi:hypothetical protein
LLFGVKVDERDCLFERLLRHRCRQISEVARVNIWNFQAFAGKE